MRDNFEWESIVCDVTLKLYLQEKEFDIKIYFEMAIERDTATGRSKTAQSLFQKCVKF